MPDPRRRTDPASPGYPQNPGRDGDHLIEHANRARQTVTWRSIPQTWALLTGTAQSASIAPRWKYIGPVGPSFETSTDQIQPRPVPRRE
jgi:hypothetical protein